MKENSSLFEHIENVRPWTSKELSLIHTQLENYKHELGIKFNVSIVDAEQWISIIYPDATKKEIKEAKAEMFYYAGYSQWEYRIIYLNPRRCTSPQELFNTLWHELLHIKHPKWSEDKVFKAANKKFPLLFGQEFKIE